MRTRPAQQGRALSAGAALGAVGRDQFGEAGKAEIVVDGGLGRLLAIVHGTLARPEQWRRLKACRLHTCEWAFYDHTKNRSGAWCTMQVCGNRTKARSYRERRARG